MTRKRRREIEGENARRVEPRVSAAEVMFVVVVVAGAAPRKVKAQQVKQKMERWVEGILAYF